MINLDNLMNAKFENLVRLANSLKGLKINNIIGKPDEKFRLVCAILRWNKRNPQKRKKIK